MKDFLTMTLFLYNFVLASEKIRSSIPCALNIAYGENPRDKFDIIGTNLKGK